MGDRANIFIKDGEDGGVYLYTHNAGSELPGVLADALSRRDRWDDSPYLARIIFCTMVRGDEDGVLGYGISSWPTDGQNRVLVVDAFEMAVSMKINGSIVRSMSFEEYIEANPRAWHDLRDDQGETA